MLTIDDLGFLFFLLFVANALMVFVNIRTVSIICNIQEQLKLKDGEKK